MSHLLTRPDLYAGRCGGLGFTVVRREIRATAFLRGMKAALVSDIHVLPRTTDSQIQKLADVISELKPDILLLGGDYADRQEDAVRLFKALSHVKTPLGGWGVPGNNDAEAWGDLDGRRKLMARTGFRLLVNESAQIPLNGGTLYIGGVDERKFGAPSARGLFPEARTSLGYSILLSHYPCMPDVTPDLMLSGHTHGGQFNCLGLTPFSIGFERLFRRGMEALAVSGLHKIGDMQLLVSKGIGGSRIQWRVGVRPEIDLITFI